MERKHGHHAVLIPYPMPGHINPLLQLTKLLHSRGFHITYIITDYVHHCLLKSGFHHPLQGIDGFRLEVVPDGLPLSGREDMQFMKRLSAAVATTFVSAVRDRVAKLREEKDSELPPITCMISGLIGPVLKVAEEIGVPGLLFWTMGACGFIATLYMKELIEKGYLHFKDESGSVNNYLDAIIDWIPGMRPLRLRDISAFFKTTDPDDTHLKFHQEAAVWASRASGVILNTFDELELDAIEGIRPKFKKLYTIGPVSAFVDRIDPPSPLQSIRLSVWKEDTGCLSWLDEQKAGSVLYINFGSIINLEARELLELAWGVAGSKYPFLWVIRPNLVVGESAVLPEAFVEETRGRGILASWCPQEEVLAHPSIGGFLTHAGWNSTLESIRRGVPMLCWPFFADQPTDTKYACDEWGVALEIEGEVRRDVVEGLVRELMGGSQKGKEMRENAAKWKKKAEEAASDSTSSSSMNIEALIHDCCNSCSSKDE